MPDTIDFIQTGVQRIMARYDQKKPIQNYFTRTFFNNIDVSEDTDVLVECRKGEDVLLPSVSRGDSPVQSGMIASFDLHKFTPAYWNTSISLTADEQKKRVWNEPIEAPFDSMTRAQFNIAEKLLGVRRSYRIGEEAAAAEVLRTGKYIPRQILNGVAVPKPAIQFPVDAAFVGGALGTLWTTSTDLPKAICDLFTQFFDDSGMTPTNAIIVGADVYSVFRNNDKFQKALDNRRIEGGQLKTIADQNFPGLAVNGTINVPMYGDVVILTYHGKYKDFDGKIKNYMDPKSIMIAQEGLGRMAYAATYGQKGGVPILVPGRENVDVSPATMDNGYTYKATLQTAMLPVPSLLNAWMYKTAVA